MSRSIPHVASVLLTACSLGCTGCSLIGLGIGSAVPRYEPTPASSVDELPVGTQLQIKMEDGSRFTGTVQSQSDPFVVRDLDTGKTRRVDPAEVWVAEKKVGSQWDKGLFIGGAIDIVVVVLATAFMTLRSQYSSMDLSNMRLGGFGGPGG